MKSFTLHIPKDIEAQLRRCRVSIRQSIRKQLAGIVARLAGSRGTSVVAEGPPHRFYVFDGYRVSYQVDPVTRRVVVLKLATASE